VTGSLIVASTVDEATQALAGGARPVAGGTDLVVGARQGKAPLPGSLVAIHRLAELRRVDEDDRVLRLGALVTHAQAAANPTVRSRLTALADGSALVGSHATRAFGTLGGNVMNASPAMDTGGPLLCFDAKITLRSSAGTRTVGMEELLAGPGQTTAEPGELLESIEVPLPAEGTGSCYVRLEYRRQMEIAVVGATAVVALQDGRIAHARVAITALAPTICRVSDAEQALLGSDAGSDALQNAAEAIEAASRPISDARASANYRAAMAAVIGRRSIEGAIARASGDDLPIPASPALHGGLR
jgi:CO/xanthine dehydrogenase FAD-binding subunit